MKRRILIPQETILMALDNIRAHKFRSALTILGIVIGIMTVIVVAAILSGLRQNVVNLIEQYGTNNIYAFHVSAGLAQSADRSYRTRKPLVPEDAIAIRQEATAVEEVAYVNLTGAAEVLTRGGLTYSQGNIQGVTPTYTKTTNIVLQEGRFIDEIDDQHRRDVMVIGTNIAEALFPGRSQVAGAQIMMAGRPFDVVGVLEEGKASAFGKSQADDAVLIPFRTAQKLYPGSKFLLLIIRAGSGRLAEAMDQVEAILRRRREVKFNDPNNFELTTSDKMIEQLDNISAKVGAVAIAVSSVGLLVGGIGVMNIMLVTVTERTHEIGIRKAVGAGRSEIVKLFLSEAVLLTLFGGAIGVSLAFGASWILTLLLPSLPAQIPIWAVVLGVVVSTMVGLVFGVWPARKASRLDPIECLRYE